MYLLWILVKDTFLPLPSLQILIKYEESIDTIQDPSVLSDQSIYIKTIVAIFKENREKGTLMRIVNHKDGVESIFKMTTQEPMSDILLAMQWMGFLYTLPLLCQQTMSWIIATENSISMHKPENINMLITSPRMKHMLIGLTR